MTSITTPPKRFHYLDSARGLAAICVVTWHFFTAFLDYKKSTFVNAAPLRVFWYGEADMLFFFIHSGFILTYSYIGRQKIFTLGNYVRFLIERVFRIYPVFLFILLVSFLIKNSIFPITSGVYTTDHIKSFWKGEYDVNDLFKQAVLFIRVPDGANLRLIPQDWTLTIEIIVGALIPIMAFLLKKNKWLYWVIIVVSIKLAHFNTYIFEFAAGVFLFYNWEAISGAWKGLNIYLKSTAVACSIVLGTCFFYFPTIFSMDRIFLSPGIDRLIVITGCCLVFSIIISSRLLQKILSRSFIVKIGRVCYSIYLVHMLLLICFADYFMQLLHRLLSLSNAGYLIIAFVAYLIATILISFVTFALVEKPFNKIGKLIGKTCETYFKNKRSIIFKKQFEV